MSKYCQTVLALLMACIVVAILISPAVDSPLTPAPGRNARQASMVVLLAAVAWVTILQNSVHVPTRLALPSASASLVDLTTARIC